MKNLRTDEFEAFVLRRRGVLLRTATALAGGEMHLAEDLVQTTLVRMDLAWARVRRGDVDAYARRTLVNALIDEKRRPHSRYERTATAVPDAVAPTAALSMDPELLAALAALPDRMRAAVVLRHVEGLSVEDAASAMGCSTGNVKSQTARGLDKIRRTITSHDSEGITS